METFLNESRRVEKRTPLDVYINKIVGDEPHLARVRDISAGGLYLYKLLEPEYMRGKRFGVELMLPDCDHVIWAVGEVVREDETQLSDGVAVRFVRIAEHDRELIRQYIAKNDDVEIPDPGLKVAYC